MTTGEKALKSAVILCAVASVVIALAVVIAAIAAIPVMP